MTKGFTLIEVCVLVVTVVAALATILLLAGCGEDRPDPGLWYCDCTASCEDDGVCQMGTCDETICVQDYEVDNPQFSCPIAVRGLYEIFYGRCYSPLYECRCDRISECVTASDLGRVEVNSSTCE